MVQPFAWGHRTCLLHILFVSVYSYHHFIMSSLMGCKTGGEVDLSLTLTQRKIWILSTSAQSLFLDISHPEYASFPQLKDEILYVYEDWQYEKFCTLTFRRLIDIKFQLCEVLCFSRLCILVFLISCSIQESSERLDLSFPLLKRISCICYFSLVY